MEILGVDDAFLITNTWLMQSDNVASRGITDAERLVQCGLFSSADWSHTGTTFTHWNKITKQNYCHYCCIADLPFRLQTVFEKVGCSIVVTSLTNVMGFALGCIAPAYEIRIFCASVALSMLFDLIFQVQ